MDGGLPAAASGDTPDPRTMTHSIRRTPGILLALLALAGCAERAPTPVIPDDAPRAAGEPAPGAVIVNEVMADPSAASDENGEWLELHNPGGADVDVGGWTLASNNDPGHTVSGSLVVPAGGYVVLARSDARKQNGRLAVDHVYGTGLVLANTADWIVLRDASGATVDSVAWSSSVPSGASRGVADPSVDDADLHGPNWTTQSSTYGKGDAGTPGAVNDGYVPPALPVASVSVSPSAATVPAGGTQAFAAAAADANGDPVATTFAWSSSDPAVATVDAAGTATALADGAVTIRATAENGVFGEATLTVSTSSGGGGEAKLAINEVMANPSAVSDASGEWFEVYNWGDASADLLGWSIQSNNDAAHTVATSVIVPAGGYVVLARETDPGVNGGVAAAYSYGGMALANAGDWLALRDASGATADSVAWASTPTGASRGRVDASADDDAVDGAGWTTQLSTFGAGDAGTPGVENDGAVPPVPPGPAVAVTVSPSSASVPVGSSQGFTAVATDADGRATPATFAWSSSATSVATVDASGGATAVSTGTATIRATADNGVWGEAALTVTDAPSASELVVRVLDVGQGDANLITNGTSRVLIDGGPSTTRFGELLDSLGLNGTTIDVVIVSHAHFDHHGGLRELFRASRGITVRYFFENRDVYSGVALAELRDSVDARVARGETVLRDTDDPCGDGSPLCTVTMNGGAKLHVMRPMPGATDANDRSTPVKLVGPDSASFTMWFAGDAEHAAIDWFDTGAEYDLFPGMKVDVLKGNHHGSCNGVRSRYVELTAPDWVTFSLAADNSYGHVHRQTTDLYASFGKPWYRTDQNGTVTIRSPGTPGGGYTIEAAHGAANSYGPSDTVSAQSVCDAL